MSCMTENGVYVATSFLVRFIYDESHHAIIPDGPQQAMQVYLAGTNSHLV